MKRLHKYLLVIYTVSITYLVMEVASLALYRCMYGVAFSFNTISEEQEGVLENWLGDGKLYQKNMIATATHGRSIHPYLGYVSTVEHDSNNKLNPSLMTEYGLLGEEDPLAASKEQNTVMVAIDGGSVSQHFFEDQGSRRILHDFFDNLPAFKNKKVVIFMLGRVAYHQPQQLLSVDYYLFQGGRLDVLINLDGKNETWDYFENFNSKVYPLYPLRWPEYLGTSFNPNALTSLGEAVIWRKVRYTASYLFHPTDFSVTFSTMWKLLDSYLSTRTTEAEARMAERGKNGRPYVLSGPNTMNNASSDDLNAYALRAWSEGSLQLYNLSQIYHFDYFHFLQPNQYVPGSKPLSDEERAQSYDLSSAHARGVQTLYPRFEAQIPILKSKGLNIYTLTSIYKNTKETVYIDDCCHGNALGYQIMSRAIVADLKEYFAHHPPATPPH